MERIPPGIQKTCLIHSRPPTDNPTRHQGSPIEGREGHRVRTGIAPMSGRLLALGLLLAALSAHADSASHVTKRGFHVACISEDLYLQFLWASLQHDHRLAKYLLENGCIILREGLDVSPLGVEERGSFRVLRARFYTDEETMILWTSPFVVEKRGD